MTKGWLVGTAVGFVAGGMVAWFAMVNPGSWMWLSDVTGRGMDQELPQATAGGGEREVWYWRAPMDPTYTSDSPGTSPMGMELVPVYADERGAVPPGTVRIDPFFAQNIGVRTAPVERRDIAMTIRTVGILAHNDQQISWVNTKYEGWIENVAVNYMGETVTQGQVLFDIYSPQIVTTQNEYLQAIDYAARLDASAYPEIAARAHALVASARQRLRFWDITDAQIDALEAIAHPAVPCRSSRQLRVWWLRRWTRRWTGCSSVPE